MGITGHPPPAYPSSSSDLLGHDALAGPPAEAPLKKKKRKGLRKLAPAYVLRQTMKGARSAAGDLLRTSCLQSHLGLRAFCAAAGKVARGCAASSVCGHSAVCRAAVKAPEEVLVPPLSGAQPSLRPAPSQIDAPVLQLDMHCHRCVPGQSLHDVTAAARQVRCATAAGCWGHRVTTFSAGKMDGRVKRPSLRRDSVDPIKMAAGAASRETRRRTKELDALVSAPGGVMAPACSNGGNRPQCWPAGRAEVLNALLTSASQQHEVVLGAGAGMQA